MHWYSLLRPFLFSLPAEYSHNLAHLILRSGLYPKADSFEHPNLQTTVCGIDFPNPIGLAAGFDKNAALIAPMLAQGFGFVEVGTVTPKPQAGNPKPRLFRLEEDEAIINRMGFNNEGVEAFLDNISKAPKGVIGINIGKNKDTENAANDYKYLMQETYEAGSYITINISSPNTPGLRDLQDKASLESLLDVISQERHIHLDQGAARKPIFIKIAPDMTDDQAKTIADTVMEKQLDGLVISNTTIKREGLQSRYASQAGGLSGKPLFISSTQMLQLISDHTKKQLPLIGVGGVSSAQDAYDKFCAGASLIQLYTGLIYQGPQLINTIKKKLVTV